MFGVRLMVDPSVQLERLSKRSPGQWSWSPEDPSCGGDSLTVNTTSVTPADVTDLIIKHSEISASVPTARGTLDNEGHIIRSS